MRIRRLPRLLSLLGTMEGEMCEDMDLGSVRYL